MSSDNYWYITKNDKGKFVAYMMFASSDEDISKKRIQWTANTLEEAIKKAQSPDENGYYTEYGYRIDPTVL